MGANKGIGRRTVSGISWTLWGTIASNLLRIGIVASLGRLLTTEDFGVVAAAMTVILLATRLKEVGLGLALVQRKDITREHVEATLGFQLALGLVAAAIVFFAAGPLASLYHMPAAANPLRALSALFVFRGLSSTSQFMCTREMRFRAIAIIDVVAYAIGSTVSIVLALSGVGPWALVIGYIVETAIDSIATIYIQPVPVRGARIRWSALKELLGYGGGQTAAGIANYFANQGDYIVVGRSLDAGMLGYYTRAYELMRFPSVVFSNVAGGVLFSSFAKLQDDPPRLGDAFRRVLFACSVVLLPASAGLIILAPEGIRILMGPGWGHAVVPFQIMAISMLWRTTFKAATIIARSSGDIWANAFWQLIYAVMVIGGAAFSVRWGIVGVATTTTAAVIINFLNLTRLALRRAPIGWSGVIAAHADGMMLAVLTTVGALPAAIGLRALHAGVAVVTLGTTIAGVILPGMYVLWQLRRGEGEWAWLVDRLRQLVGKKRNKRNKRAVVAEGELASRD